MKTKNLLLTLIFFFSMIGFVSATDSLTLAEPSFITSGNWNQPIKFTVVSDNFATFDCNVYAGLGASKFINDDNVLTVTNNTEYTLNMPYNNNIAKGWVVGQNDLNIVCCETGQCPFTPFVNYYTGSNEFNFANAPLYVTMNSPNDENLSIEYYPINWTTNAYNGTSTLNCNIWDETFSNLLVGGIPVTNNAMYSYTGYAFPSNVRTGIVVQCYDDSGTYTDTFGDIRYYTYTPAIPTYNNMTLTLTSPTNNSGYVSTQKINFTATSETNTTIPCKIYNNNINIINVSATNNTLTSTNYNFGLGLNTVYINCSDDVGTVQSNYATYTLLQTINITINLTSPNGQNTSLQTYPINFTSVSAYNNTFQCKAYVNNVNKYNVTATNNTMTFNTTTLFNTGLNNVFVNCTDFSGEHKSNIVNYTYTPCAENWTGYYVPTTCNGVINTTMLVYNDTNHCGTTNNLPVDNGTVSNCCVENFVANYTPNNCDGLINETLLFYNDLNMCNTTFTLPVNNNTLQSCCVENWLSNDTSCNGVNYTVGYYDDNSCGTTFQLPVDNGDVLSCTINNGITGMNVFDTTPLINTSISVFIIALIGGILITLSGFNNNNDVLKKFGFVVIGVIVILLVIFLTLTF